jgi:hypothetical protein
MSQGKEGVSVSIGFQISPTIGVQAPKPRRKSEIMLRDAGAKSPVEVMVGREPAIIHSRKAGLRVSRRET